MPRGELAGARSDGGGTEPDGMLGRDGVGEALGVLPRFNPDGDVGVGEREGTGVLLVGLGGWNGRVGELLVDFGPSVAA